MIRLTDVMREVMNNNLANGSLAGKVLMERDEQMVEG